MKYLAGFFAIGCLVAFGAWAQTAPSSVTVALPSSRSHLTNASSYVNATTGQKICTSAIPAVIANIRAQLSDQSPISVSMGDASFVYANKQFVHCVTQMNLVDVVGQTYPYTLGV